MKKILVLSILTTVCLCAAGFFKTTTNSFQTIPASPQRTGDPQKGYDYIMSAAYMQSGLPFYLYQAGFGKKNTGYLKDHDQRLGYDFNLTTAHNGNAIVAPTCFQCHAEKLNDKLIIGLGNNTKDFTSKQVYNIRPMQDLLLYYLKTLRPKEYQAAYRFSTATRLVDKRLFTECRGVNGADRLFALLVSYRDPATLTWRNADSLHLSSTVIPSDVPAWWLMKKKNALYYSGEGRGDFGRFMLSSALLTMNDSSDAAEIDRHMPDVLSYVRSLEPPPYPDAIDEDLAVKGKLVFTNTCSSCHGQYGENETYPNKLIPAAFIGTDPWLSRSNFADPSVMQWFNNSWFSQGDHPSYIEPFDGYIAPPLDGIWATAPYFHNGSVPALEMVINSS
ncbi:MAG: hypothetical protein EOO05_21715, partial [Chitinophagaceae bacterium]